MATTAKELIRTAKSKVDQAAGKGAHPDTVRLAQAAVNLAVAQSNVELAEALNTFTEAVGKNSGTVKEAMAALTTKVGDLAKR
ncbi:hypothetical protein [Streptomyces sp. Ru72]|uniref:hypothetical protein n=1 Tax=Streptomyces sp. Ru72 TaxID=2080747 RepID=UPI000CDCF9F6|nr:hypothetical protein [Streptomyces sp. Ru72]POX48216.1 hypothetical protein C3488_21215 [Streptomyces sp. Ru72]